MDANGTLLAHEIESWNESGTSYVWVSVPQIDASSGTDYIWMYYGNAAARRRAERRSGLGRRVQRGVAPAQQRAGFGRNQRGHQQRLDQHHGRHRRWAELRRDQRPGVHDDTVRQPAAVHDRGVVPHELGGRQARSSGSRTSRPAPAARTGIGSSMSEQTDACTSGRTMQPTDSEDVANSTATYTDGAMALRRGRPQRRYRYTCCCTSTACWSTPPPT